MIRYLAVVAIVAGLHLQACGQKSKGNQAQSSPAGKSESAYRVIRTEQEWREILSPEQYEVLRNKGTEYPGTGKYYRHSEKGMYTCAGCGAALFGSDAKYASNCGWPSYYQPVSDTAVGTKADYSHGMVRTEIICNNCGGHLGHVFDDGPRPTGLRYCVNSASLNFEKK